MSVRASLLAALVLGSSLTIAPARRRRGSRAGCRPRRRLPTRVPPEVTSVPVGAEPDGTAVRLDVSVWPQSSGKHPVVLLAHGFGGSKDSVTSQANDLHERGYVVIAWSARGHGQSGGRIHLNDPAYEIADARTLLDLAAKRSDVELDAPGDPRAGVMGALLRRGARPHARRAPTAASTASSRPSRGTTSPTPSSPRRAVTTAADHGSRPRADRRRRTRSSRSGRRTSSSRPSAAAGQAASGAGAGAARCGRFDPTHLPPLRAGVRDGHRLARS